MLYFNLTLKKNTYAKAYQLTKIRSNIIITRFPVKRLLTHPKSIRAIWTLTGVDRDGKPQILFQSRTFNQIGTSGAAVERGRALIVGSTFWPKGLGLGFRREADFPWLWPWARLSQSCHRSFAAAAASWKSPRLGREWPMAFPDRSVVPPPSTVGFRYEATFL